MCRPGQAPAFQAAKKLLEHFPDHVGTLEILASLCHRNANLKKPGYLQRALDVNPLERCLAAGVGCT